MKFEVIFMWDSSRIVSYLQNMTSLLTPTYVCIHYLLNHGVVSSNSKSLKQSRAIKTTFLFARKIRSFLAALPKLVSSLIFKQCFLTFLIFLGLLVRYFLGTCDYDYSYSFLERHPYFVFFFNVPAGSYNRLYHISIYPLYFVSPYFLVWKSDEKVANPTKSPICSSKVITEIITDSFWCIK